MNKLAVLISNSGTGTNLQAIINAIENKKINAQIVVVISDTKEAFGLQRAKKHKIQTAISGTKEQLLKILKRYNPDFVVLAGWKQIILDEVIDSFPNKILNVHPGLIPDEINGVVKNPDGTIALWNKGKLTDKAIQNFIDKKATYAGSTVHFLSNEFDFGPVLGRTFEKIVKNDTVASLYTRLKNKEHQIYVEALQKLCLATVLVVDGGGRGATLVDKYTQSPEVGRVLAVPGNDMLKMSVEKPIVTFPNIKTTNVKEILKIAKDYKVDLVDIAQDDAVAAGLTNALQKAGFRAFGPTKEAGQIEWDKAWSRNFMINNSIPSPSFKICSSEGKGTKFIDSEKDGEWFIKASGLAAGKGAIYAKNNHDAKKAILEMKNFGKSGEVYLIEQCIYGEEFSSFAIVDGKDFILIGHAQDHKRAYDGDEGPNTGGMGCSSPPKAITPKIEKQIKAIFKRTVQGLVKMKRHYRGVLYLGGMITKGDKVQIIEFNARWGDPEAEVIIPALENDLYEIVSNVIDGKIKNLKIKKDNLYRITVAATAKGYPGDYSKSIGKEIRGLEKIKSSGVKIFGAGTKIKNKKYIISGGRLFYVTAAGKNVKEARKIAYNALSKIQIENNGLHYRKDIGYRDLNRT